jgi:hypothetical protein
MAINVSLAIGSKVGSIWVNFGGPWNGKVCYILCHFGIYYSHLVHIMAIWYMLWPFGTYYGHLVHVMAIWYILWPFGTCYGHLVI